MLPCVGLVEKSLQHGHSCRLASVWLKFKKLQFACGVKVCTKSLIRNLTEFLISSFPCKHTPDHPSSIRALCFTRQERYHTPPPHPPVLTIREHVQHVNYVTHLAGALRHPNPKFNSWTIIFATSIFEICNRSRGSWMAHLKISNPSKGGESAACHKTTLHLGQTVSTIIYKYTKTMQWLYPKKHKKGARFWFDQFDHIDLIGGFEAFSIEIVFPMHKNAKMIV